MHIRNQVEEIFRESVAEASITAKDVLLTTLDVIHKCNPRPIRPTDLSARGPVSTKKHVIARIISHATNPNNKSHYQVRWYACGSEHDMRKSILSLLLSCLNCHYHRRKLPLLGDTYLDMAQRGFRKKAEAMMRRYDCDRHKPLSG